jgi:cytochrome b561
LVLGLVCLLLLWKLISPSPGLQNELKSWERLGAYLAHGLLLLAMFAIPVTGYVISTSAGKGISMFELFEIPALAPSSDALRDLAVTAHYTIAYGLIAIIVLHAGAAIKHQIIDKHGTLKRML